MILAVVAWAIVASASLLLAGCNTAQDAKVQTALQTPYGALFCQLQTAAGPTVVTLVDGAAAAANPALGVVTVLAAGALASDVQAECAQAAKNTGAVAGIPVSPPASTAAVGSVAVTPPAGAPTTAAPAKPS